MALTAPQQAALAQLEQMAVMTNDEMLETILLWHLGFGAGAPVPPPHPGEPTTQDRAAIGALARYLNTPEGWQAGTRFAEPFRAYITRTLAGSNAPMPGYPYLMSSEWEFCLDGTGVSASTATPTPDQNTPPPP